MSTACLHHTVPPLTAIILGAGLAGIGMAITLRQAGITDFTLLEQAQNIGDVWRDNSHLGSVCSAPSRLRSFLFAPNSKRAQAFASQAELYSDLQHCPDSYQLDTHIQFGAEVQRAIYNEKEALWQVSLNDGNQLYAAVLINATGLLSYPAVPRLNSIATCDCMQHSADVISSDTAFVATDCCAPLRITGRAGLDLKDACQNGVQAYLGMSVPGFPNFFMLYRPASDVGHNTSVRILESQRAHVLRCYQTLQAAQATTIEVEDTHSRHFNSRLQKCLATAVWQNCPNLPVDKSEHNSIYWLRFSLPYRWLMRFSSLQAYSFTRALPSSLNTVDGVTVIEPQNRLEKFNANFMRRTLRVTFRAFMGPPFSAKAQRRVVNLFATMTPGVAGVIVQQFTFNGVATQVITPKASQADGVILYLHGGAFCLGSATSHRSLTTRLAIEAGMPVWVPEYRLAPEHPYPAGLDDALACYAQLRQYYTAEQIVIGGDSAGGALALALMLTLRERGEHLSAGLLLISPVTDGTLSGPTLTLKIGEDPMLRGDWLEQALHWYQPPLDVKTHSPLEIDLAGLPPMLIQVGEQELLLSDSTRLAQHATDCGVSCRLEIHTARWHVFHLQANTLHSARQAIRRLGVFARQRVVDKAAEAQVNM